MFIVGPRDTFSGLRMNADEFCSLGETADRLELIDGVVVMSPSPLPVHQRLAARLLYQLETFAHNGGGCVVFPETDIRFSNRLVYRPDVAVYRAGRVAETPDRLTLVPDLVIEILPNSSRSLDLVTKREDYDRFGVAEYWVVDTDERRVHAWNREGGRLVECPSVEPMITSIGIPGFVLDQRRLWDGFTAPPAV